MDITNILKEFIIEASKGEIDAYFTYNIIFETIIGTKKATSSKAKEGTIIPCLTIKNLNNFTKLLEIYIQKALNFYDLSSFEGTEKEKIKMIIASLFADATFDDFANPIEFLNRRINFFENTQEENLKSTFIESLNSALNANIVKDKVVKGKIYNETPYSFQATLRSNNGVFKLPEVKFGIADNTLYIYAIQNSPQEKSQFTKKINRALYKVNDGFQDDSTANLGDTTASFLIVSAIILSYMQIKNITKIKISSILIERWNAKRIAISKKTKFKNLPKEEEEALIKDQERIQSNLTEKFIRTFLRLSGQYKNLEISAYPYEMDSYLSLNVTGKLISENTLLNDISSSITNNVKHL